MKHLVFFLGIWIYVPVAFHATAQETYVPETVDKLDGQQATINFDDFYLLVLTNHPLVRQAYLLGEYAREEVRLARGSYDPGIAFDWTGKKYGDTEYYNLMDASLKIPTWFPIDPVVGFEKNQGKYLNPENFISEGTNNQQVYAGISLPVGRGLFIDKRRALVRQAQLFSEMSEAEQVSVINKVLLEAALDYWEWYFAWQNYQLSRRSIDIAQEIFERTRMAFEFGEAAAIDTVQAKISLVSRQTAFQQASMDVNRATLELSNHLWDDTGRPLELKPGIEPAIVLEHPVDDAELLSLVALARENHPELLKLDVKSRQLEVSRQLAAENLKPRLDLKYYWLDQPVNTAGNWTGFGLGENYKFGIDFEFPLFLRKERAKLNQVRLNLTNNALEQDYQVWQIINNINKEFVLVTNTYALIEQQRIMVDNYSLLVQAERLNLENGESDLFKINIQLDKLIESQTKLLRLQADYQKALARFYWQAGVGNIRFPGLN